MARPLKRKLIPEAHGVAAVSSSASSAGASSSSARDAKIAKRGTDTPPTPLRAAPASAEATSRATSAAAALLSPLDEIAAAYTPPSRVDRLTGNQLDPPLLRKLLDLVRRNMSDYERGDAATTAREKREELVHEDTRVIVVRSGSQLLGFASYRLNVLEEGVRVCYLYELQLEQAARGMRLGSTLVSEVEAVAKAACSLGLMLTVHTRNAAARRFYRNDALGFEVAPISPAECAPPSIAASCEYEILQKLWDAEARRSLLKSGAQARTANYAAAIDSGTFRVKLVMKGGRRSASPTEGPDTQKAADGSGPPTPVRRRRGA